MSDWQTFLKQYVTSKGYVKGRSNPGVYDELRKEAGDAWRAKKGLPAREPVAKPALGCQLNSKSGRCKQYDGPDDDKCRRSPKTNKCVKRESVTREDEEAARIYKRLMSEATPEELERSRLAMEASRLEYLWRD